ncbi:TonB-dependent receptor plug domain-containing protein [Rubrivirga sp. IMCC43871]|uniref:TonB-dependent receptor plug domain-containing protein n=1 Tax=Rubrivirga sp. IMCC43871 TaxID=3391575 RepID=UPI00398FC16F
MRPLLPLTALLLSLGATAQPVPDEAFDDLSSLLDEPVQTAATYTQRSSEAPASVTIVTSDEIDRAGYRTLAETLNSVRGFYLSDDRNYTYVGVRGLSRPSDYNNRVAVLVNGVAAQEGVSGSGSIGAGLGIPLSAVDRIEVIRGPGSTLYGTGAMFGVVNVILKDARTLTGVRGLATASSTETLGGEVVAAAALGRGVEATVAVYGFEDQGPDVYFTEFDAPETGGGVAVGQDWERSAGALASVRAGDVRLDVRLSERDKGIPTGSFETAFGLDAWTRDRTAAASLRVETDLSPRLSLFAIGSFHHAYYYGVYPYDDGDGSGPYDTYDDSNSSVAQAESRLRWDANASNRVVVGALASANVQSRYRGYDDEDVYIAVDEPYESGALYGQIESQLRDGLSVTAGARLDVVRGDAALSPRGAAVWTPDDRTSLKLIVGSAFRAPSTYELAYVDPYINQVAAPDLRPEYVSSAEASLTREVRPGVRLDGALFVTRVSDLIDPQEAADGTIQFVNVGRAESYGAEAGVASLLGGWRTRASYGLQHAVDPDLDGETLSNAPMHVGKATAFGPLAGGVSLALSGRAESGRRTVFDETTDAHVVVDAAVSADVFGDAGRVTLGVRNAFDADYALPGGFEHLQSAIPQRPRSAYLRLDVQL